MSPYLVLFLGLLLVGAQGAAPQESHSSRTFLGAGRLYAQVLCFAWHIDYHMGGYAS